MKKYITNLFFLLIWIVLPVQIMAQGKAKSQITNQEIIAQIVNNNGNPISGVNILGNEGSVQSKSNAAGEFIITVKKGSNIVIEVEGYEKLVVNTTRISNNFNKIVLQPSKDWRTNADIKLPFQTMKKSRTTGNISVVDAKSSHNIDSRLEVAAHLNGKITGNISGFNFHGMGNAITVVDGIIRNVENLNMQEIEQITVLKDAYSRMLYGADGDTPVIMITTKSGGKFEKVLNFNIEQGFSTAISKPKFLDAATYMETYNKAYMNDGKGNHFYTPEVIDSTRNNLDPILYPNNDYWSSEYVKNSTNYTNMYAEASGGNDKVQYFMNLGWKHNKGWLALPKDDTNNKFNIRGKIDYEVTNWLKMKTDIVAIFDVYQGPKSKTFYSDAATLLPNTSPLLIPINKVANFNELAGKNPIGNSLLGGTNVYQKNLYGDMTRGGSRMDMNRFLQYMVGFDIDLNEVTKGLALSAMVDMDFSNYYSQIIDNQYAVYAIDQINNNDLLTLRKIGEDKLTTSQTLDDENNSFRRSYNGYITANYDRTFGKHQVSAVMLSYYNQLIENKVLQNAKRLRFGAQFNYTYDNKYIIEVGALSEGSNKMNPEKRFTTNPSFGAGWIISNENFLKENSLIDYLKLRGTYGIIANDNFTLGKYNGYFLYEASFIKQGVFNYNNGQNSNSTITIESLGNVYSFQQRKEFVGGFDAYLFNKKLWVESSYWNSLSSGNIVSLSNNTSGILGLIPVGNFNETRFQGMELGLNYQELLGDLRMSVALNYIYTKSAITKWEEPEYAEKNAHLRKVGTSANALWGLTSAGLYSVGDFDTDGKTLQAGLPKPTYGLVQAGDIKYLDINGDNVINSDDQSVLGSNGNNQQISLNIDLAYRNWQLFILGTSSWGGKGFKNSNYYRFKGTDAKYSEIALKSYDPENPNPNAEYPRLTLTNNNNNNINSTFWMYDRANFWLSTLQVSYNVALATNSALKSLKIYARGGNLLTLGKNTEITQLNWNSSPQARNFTLGMIANF